MMTNKQFFNSLKRNNKDQDWDFAGDEIRNYHNTELYCPLTYVAYKKTGETFDCYDYLEAARNLGISKLRAEAIAGAADNSCKTKNRKKLRRLLLKALGLMENENV